jgi:hypothetical protein
VWHVKEKDVVAFQAVDHSEGDSGREEYGETYRGVINPLLRWTTKVGNEMHEVKNGETHGMRKPEG